MRSNCWTGLLAAVLVVVQACSPAEPPNLRSTSVSATSLSVQPSPGNDCVEFVPVQVDIDTILDQIWDPQSPIEGWRIDTETYVPQVVEWNLGDRVMVFEHCFEVVEVFSSSARLLVNDEGVFFSVHASGPGPGFLTGATLDELTGPDLGETAASDRNLPREQRRGYGMYEVTLPDGNGEVVLQVSAFEGRFMVD